MRHRKAGTKLNRTASHRKALMRNMVTSLFEYGQIRTTTTKAKALRPLAEKMITLAKKGDLHARRQALAVLTKKSVTHKLFSEIKDKFMDRNGGYTSIVKIGPRKGDAAEMALIQLVDTAEAVKPKKKPAKKKAQPKKAAEAKAETKAAPKKAAKKDKAPVETEAAPVVDEQPEVQDEAVAEAAVDQTEKKSEE